MGWFRDGVFDHEGHVVYVVVDGREASGSVSEGVLAGRPTKEDQAADRDIWKYGDGHVGEVIVPWTEVVWWRGKCTCGWRSRDLPATARPGDVERDCPDEVAEDVFIPQWHEHVAPFAALIDLERLTAEADQLETRKSELVELARTGGASWTQVGRASGLSKQGAQQRWG